MSVDMFDTRTLLQAVKAMKPAKTFLRDTFFGNQNVFFTETVDVDLVKGKRRLAPFVHPRLGSKTVNAIGYETKTYKPPMVAPDYYFTGQDLQKRLPGENIYAGTSPDDRLSYLIGNKLAEFDEMISRREEWMCAQALFTGQIPIVGDGYNEIMDFSLTNKETLATKGEMVLCCYRPDGKPDYRAKTLKRAVIKASGVNPDYCVMAVDAADAFMAHPDVTAYFNSAQKANIDMGQLAPKMTIPGVYYIGRVNELGLDLYSYEEYFIDPSDDTEKALVPSGKVMLSSSAANFKMLYGAVIDVSIGSFAMPRVPKSWIEEKPSARILQLSSRPLPVPVNVDGYYVGTVL